ncbi:MAG: NADH-quinone oxidoreductase subunit D [Planctomycetes bacterium]|nr:NADH-quinone oxidoreductase subunit D [Planctomycetota bacterium]
MPESETAKQSEGFSELSRAVSTFVGEELVINFGPQHPSMHGVLRLIVKSEGEIVSEITPVIGYLHRGMEKIAERLNYHQFMPYTDRIDYLASMNCNFAYAATVEKLAGIEIPKRAEYIRVIMAELNRIASHLVFFGTAGLESGAWTPIVYAFREREYIVDLFDMTCGQRLTYNYFRIGGVADDLPKGFMEKARAFCDYFEPKIKEYNELLSYNEIFIKRTANVAVLPPETAVKYSVTGPNLRASGVKWDLRKNEPYSIYPEIDFDIPVSSGEKGMVGDTWNRYIIRMREMEESVKIIRQCLDKIPEGDYLTKVPRLFKAPPGEVYCRFENPRGELGFYLISDGGKSPYRLKIRTPSFAHLWVLPEISTGGMISDLIVAFGSLDLVVPEIDR